MSIKKLFDSNKPNDFLTSTNLEEEVVKNAPELESADNVREQIERINRFIPQIDFGDPNNFVTYGSAQSYYEDSFNRITNQYPYDGSEEEITEFLNESNYLDLYILEKKYPRTTGYITFQTPSTNYPATTALASDWTTPAEVNREYIKVIGGPHTASGGMPTGKLHLTFTGSNYYDTDIYGTDGTLALGRVGTRESNLKADPSKGITVEFWLKKSAFNVDRAEKEVIFDLWNGQGTSSVDTGVYSPNPGYGRLAIWLTGSGVDVTGLDPLRIHFASGSSVLDGSLLTSAHTTASIADNNWHHYAVTIESDSSTSTLNTYVDGILNRTITSATTFGEITGSMNAFIGALQTSPSGNAHSIGALVPANYIGAGALSASMDEFRYWKSKRSEKDIQNNWWTQVRGGTNNEIANAELGVYYKFNEGITGTSSIDSKILDYSGRISNGIYVNYRAVNALVNSRNTGSAMVSASAAAKEYADPIIYSTHPDVKSLYEQLSVSGSIYDFENNASVLDTIPDWIAEEDELNGDLQLKKLSQIIGSYFDTLNLQIKSIPDLNYDTYLSSSYKPTPFARNLLSSRGLMVPEIFVDASLLEIFASRRDDREYNLDLNEVKNLIYQNIYNNLVYIYKSKGTEKAFRNLMHCYGIGEEIIKFNAYGNNTVFRLEDTHYDTVTRKNYVDFNDPTRFGGVVYQNSSSANLTETNTTYISGTNAHLAYTSEVEVIFPRKFEFNNPQYFVTSFVSSSIFGTHTANSTTPSDFAWIGGAADYGIQLYSVRTHPDSKDAYFLLKSRRGDFEVTSSVYSNVYDNQKWNFAVRVKNKKRPYAPAISGSSGSAAGDIVVDWYGVNIENGVVKNEFNFTTSSFEGGGVPSRYLTTRRRYYMGAERANTVGVISTYSDVRISSLRHYASYLDNSVIRAHALDPDNFGTKYPSRNFIFGTDSNDLDENNQTIPEAASLALHWDFSQVSWNSANTQFSVEDASSGSISILSRYANTAKISHTIMNQHAGRGYFPNITNTTPVISKEYVQASRQRLPEVVNTSDAVNVLSRDDELYPRDAAVSQTFFAFEKSMYGVISQEILNMFATIIEFNNLIGDVVHKYRGEYKGLRLLRNLFFEKIENNPDLDKFIDYYKWIDSSLVIFLQQFVPASANVSDEIRVMVEDHVLGRSKYRHQYPHLDHKGNERWGSDEDKIEGRAKGINELAYNWRFGHAPLNNLEATSALWWKDRAKRTNTNFTTAATIDSARQSLNDIILSFNSASADKFNTGVGATGVYEGSAYATRRFATPLRMSFDIGTQIGGGYNYSRNNKPDAVYSIIKRGVAAARYDASKGSFRDIDIAEAGPPIIQTKRKFNDILVTDNLDSTSYETNKFGLPTIVYSSSAGSTGYRSDVNGIEYVGHHYDNYGDDYEVPMQGPFTNHHVGGNRHRHTDITIDPALTSSTTRPEAWSLLSGIYRANDSSFTRPSTSPQYRRDETAKRPLNIKNIQHRTGSHTIAMGNFNKSYEVVQTSDRRTNNSEFVKREGFSTASVTTDLLGYVGGLVDYAKPTRTRREHVIVERFSAPGGPEVAGDTIGGPGLDYESGQYSPYNSLNYRNTTVRQPLQTLLTERSERFGLRSGSSDETVDISAGYTINYTASFHKTNRNILRRLEFQNTTTNVITASTFDNYYVQHMIPRSDYQYAWITASHNRFVNETTNTDVLGYLPYDGFVSTSAGLIAALNFVSASDAGSVITSGERRTKEDYATLAAPGHWAPTDFVGMNTTIIEPISSSGFTIGYPLSTDIIHYYNYSDIGAAVTNTVNRESFIEKIGISADATSTKASCLNSIINHRNGPYGYPTWKQLRVGQGALPRYYRKNNIYTHTPFGGTEITVDIAGGTNLIKSKYGPTFVISQSAITTRYLPLLYDLGFNAGVKMDGTTIIKDAIIKATFGNNLITFEDPDLSNALGESIIFGDSVYKQILKMYQDGAASDPASPVQRINSLTYQEMIYPSAKNMYTGEIRGRTNYENNFWRNARSDRTAKGMVKKPTNSAGSYITQSSWALDPIEGFTTRNYTNMSPLTQTGSHNDVGRRAGELQNDYVQYHRLAYNQADVGPLYARKHAFAATQSVVAPWGMYTPELSIAGLPRADVYYSSGNRQIFKLTAMFTGEAAWDAPNQCGRFTGSGESPVFKIEQRTPFSDSYSEWSQNIRRKAKGYSIIPEFRMEEFLGFYRNRGDFLIDNPKFLQIAGTPSGSRIPQNSDEDNFFTTFTNSDFMKYFEIIKDDHKDAAVPDKLTLKCRAIKKFIPYDGFYPAERTVQMSKEFISSLTSSVTYVTGANGNSPARLRPLLQPIMAPGILFNTIKSGVAVDFPILSGSATGSSGLVFKAGYIHASTAVTNNSYALFSNSREISVKVGGSIQGPLRATDMTHIDGFDYRMPFETLLEPEKYLANLNIQDNEPNPSCRLDSMVNWSGEGAGVYKQMMNNFLAETINIFSPKGRLTSIRSKKQKNFNPVTPGIPYGMRVKMWRSMDKAKIQSGSWGAFPVPQNTREILYKDGDQDLYTGGTSSALGASGYYPKNITARETLTMYSRPSAFGPPLGLIEGTAADFYKNGSGASVGSIHDFAPQNGVYASHTPPYYDGECWFDIIFWPKGLRTTAQAIAAEGGSIVLFGPDEHDSAVPYKPTLEEIFASPSTALFTDISGASDSARSLVSGAPLAGSFTRKWRFDQEELLRDPNATHWTSVEVKNAGGTQAYGPACGKFVNEWSMQLDASLNIFRKSTKGSVDGNKTWEIQTKFESPILDFQHAKSADGLLTLTGDAPSNVTIPRGMWHQFGRLPTGSQGVYIQVTDIPEEWLNNHPSSSLIPDLAESSAPGFNIAGSHYIYGTRDERIKSAKTYYNGYSVPVRRVNDSTTLVGDTSNTTVTVPTVQSLVDICGFDTEPRRIGEIAQRRTIHEAIVAIPYVEKEGERKFFRIMAPTDPDFVRVAGPSIKRQVRLMNKYILPPFFDFVNNPDDVSPIAMYMFEFKHRLSKDDLSHIWQNLPPKIGTRFRKTQATVSHRLFDNELLGSLTNLRVALADSSRRIKIKRTELPNKLRWMVFKVKQRANGDYFEMTQGQERTMPFYTSNWPYDFCSLIELAAIKAETVFKGSGEDRSFKLPDPVITAPDLEVETPSIYAEAAYGVLGTTVDTGVQGGGGHPSTPSAGEIIIRGGTVDAYAGVGLPDLGTAKLPGGASSPEGTIGAGSTNESGGAPTGGVPGAGDKQGPDK